jgi:hypothetical protein
MQDPLVQLTRRRRYDESQFSLLESDPSETYTLNTLSLNGPIARTPINVTIDPEPGTVQVIPAFGVDNAPVIRGTVDPAPGSASMFVLGPAPSVSGNLTWNVPESEYSLDLQYIATHHVGLTAGGSYASVGGYQFINFRGGLSFFTVDRQFGFRLDAGVLFNGVRYRSRTTVTTVIDAPFASSRQYVSNFDDSGLEQSIGASLGLTVNSAYSESIVNGFLHLGVAWQPLIDYGPASPDTILGAGDARPAVGNVKCTSAVLSFGGGISLELGRGNRALLGVRGAQLLDVYSPVPRPVWQPFVEFVFSL